MTTPPDAPDAAAPPAVPAPGSTPAGVAAALAAVTVWGLGNTIIASVPMSGIAVSFYRLLLGAVLYVAVLYARGGRLGRRSFRLGGWGGVAFGLNVATFFAALQLTSVANATTISALQPLVIMVFAAAMFGERIRPRHVVCGVVATLGVALVAFGTSRGATGSVAGDVMAVLALIAWAWYFIASKKAREQLDTLEYMTVINVVAFVVVAPIALVTGELFAEAGRLDGTAAVAIVAIVLVPGSGHILINWAHNHTTLVTSALITLALPVVATASAAVFLDQRVAAIQVVGIATVLVSLAAVIVGDARSTATALRNAEATEPAP